MNDEHTISLLKAQVVELRARLDDMEDDSGDAEFMTTPWATHITEREPYPAFFDLVDVTSNSFAILGTGQYSNAAWITGTATAITASGLTWATDRWTSGTISASTYVWLELDTAAGTAVLKKGAALPAGGIKLRICPLWYIPFSSTITLSTVVDMRYAMEARQAAVDIIPENDHSWHWQPTAVGATSGTITEGNVYIGTAKKTLSGFNGSVSGLGTTTHYWVALDREYATATWGSGGTVPDNTDTTEYFHVLTLTYSAGTVTATERWQSDIRVHLFS